MLNIIKGSLYFVILLWAVKSTAQIGIGTTTPHSSSIVELSSQDKGFLPPRMNLTQRDLILNPASGLMLYNYTTKCLEINIGTPAIPNWHCLMAKDEPVNGSTNGSSEIGSFDCNTTSTGVLTQNQLLSGVSQTMTFNVTKIGTYDIQTDVVNGVSFSASGEFTSTGSQTVELVASGTPVKIGSYEYTLNTSPSCSFIRSVPSTLRMLSLASYSIGTTQHLEFFNQLTNPTYYGSTGIYNRIINYQFDVQASASFLDSKTLADLLNDYDVISVGFQDLSPAQALLVKQFVDAGGLLLALYDAAVGGNLNAQFSGVSPVVSIPGGPSSVNANNDDILQGVFGDGRNSLINGAGSYGKFVASDIPSGSTILATNGNDYGIWTKDVGLGRAMFYWDEGAFRASNVTGLIDDSQEIALHNTLTYLFNKKF